MRINKAPLRKQWSLDILFAVLIDRLVLWQTAIADDLDLCGDELNLRADFLFAHGRQGCAAVLANALFFLQPDEALSTLKLRHKLYRLVEHAPLHSYI